MAPRRVPRRVCTHLLSSDPFLREEAEVEAEVEAAPAAAVRRVQPRRTFMLNDWEAIDAAQRKARAAEKAVAKAAARAEARAGTAARAEVSCLVSSNDPFLNPFRQPLPPATSSSSCLVLDVATQPLPPALQATPPAVQAPPLLAARKRPRKRLEELEDLKQLLSDAEYQSKRAEIIASV